MKYKQLKHGILGVLLSASFAVSAQDYPAADFQPKVVYQDESVGNSASSSSPCVSKEAATAKQEKVEFDAKYPASNFQPKVIYSSAN
jgi:hypothetical protein